MVAVVLILVVGPKDLPPMLRSFGRTVKKYRGMANDFKRQFDDALEESELDELRQTVAEAKTYNPLNQVTDAVKDVGAEINEAVDDVKPVEPWTPKPDEISDAARSVGKKDSDAKAASAAKTPAKKPAASKPAARKTTTTKTAAAKTPVAKKPVAKKPAAKKPEAKKPTARKTIATKSVTSAKTTRKPRATAAKKPATSTGKAKAE